MSSETTTVVELQLDVGNAVVSAAEYSDLLDGLRKSVKCVEMAASKMFNPLRGGMKNIQAIVHSVSKSLSELTGKLAEVKNTAKITTPEAPQGIDGLFQGITDGYNSIIQIWDQIEKFDKNSVKLQTLFEELVTAPNIGNLMQSMFPKTTELFDTVVIPFKETFGGIADVISGISGVFSGMSLGWGAAIAGIIALIVLLVTNWDTVQAAIVTAWEAIQSALATAAEWLNTTVVQPVVGFFTDAWNGIVSIFTGVGMWFQENVIQPIIDVFSPIVEWYASLFSSIWQTVSDVFHNIGVIISGCWETLQAVWGAVADWFYNTVIQPVADFFTGLWDGVVNAATLAWDGIMAVFGAVAGFFGDVFGAAWAAVVGVFSAAGDIFNDIVEGIQTVFITIVNGLITGINAVVAVPFNGINGAIDIIRNIRIFDIQPFGGLKSISVPQIPYLAKGAVLPANKPFLAVVGDQRHGTNVEAPLTTIQEAVALVMEDYAASNMAGHEATVAVLRDLLEAVLGIRIGDDVIGRAAERYRSKMAVVRGGW